MEYPKVKVSVILCPFYNCKYACIDDSADKDDKVIPTDQLVTRLKQHLFFNHGIEINNELINSIQFKINYIRTHKKIPYTDPFLFVSYEEIKNDKRLI